MGEIIKSEKKGGGEESKFIEEYTPLILTDAKMGIGKPYPTIHSDSCSWTFQSLNNFKESYRATFD